MAEGRVTADTVGASAGIGTLVILLADRIQPADSLLRQLLVVGAPSITLISGWLWAFARNQVFVLIDDLNSKRTFQSAQKLLEAARARGADDNQIALLSEKLDEIERQKMQGLIERSSVDFERR